MLHSFLDGLQEYIWVVKEEQTKAVDSLKYVHYLLMYLLKLWKDYRYFQRGLSSCHTSVQCLVQRSADQ